MKEGRPFINRRGQLCASTLLHEIVANSKNKVSDKYCLLDEASICRLISVYFGPMLPRLMYVE